MSIRRARECAFRGTWVARRSASASLSSSAWYCRASSWMSGPIIAITSDRPRSDCLDDDEKRPEVGGGELPAKRRASVAEPERDGAGLDRRRDGGQDLRPQLFEVDLVA